MLFRSLTKASLLALSAFASAASLKYKRSSESGVSLYVYGTDANGASIFYADGLAYFGSSATSFGSVAANITFTVDTDDTTVPWTIQSNTSTVSFNETLDMYIVPTNGSFYQVGFASSNSSSMPTGAVTTGFGFFGTIVSYVASESDYEIMFWANETTTDGIYALYWDAGASSLPNGSFPVTVKTTAPITLSI